MPAEVGQGRSRGTGLKRGQQGREWGGHTPSPGWKELEIRREWGIHFIFSRFRTATDSYENLNILIVVYKNKGKNRLKCYLYAI